ncbi:MAG: sialidase family protein, partial [Bacteroidota bacterium]
VVPVAHMPKGSGTYEGDRNLGLCFLSDDAGATWGRSRIPADLADGAAFHDVKEAFMKAAQAEGDDAYTNQKKNAPADKQPPAGQRIKLQTDAILDGLILKLDPK